MASDQRLRERLHVSLLAFPPLFARFYGSSTTVNHESDLGIIPRISAHVYRHLNRIQE
jgi:hypothetical protein